jgi:TonB family protein
VNRSTPRWWWTWVASIAVHAGFFGGGAWVAYRTLAAQKSEPLRPVEPDVTLASIVVELPTVLADGPPSDERAPDPVGIVPDPHGGNAVARVDDGASGTGGDATASQQAINLSDADERLRLSPDLVSRLDRDQLQRLFVARVRQSWEDRRSTPKPTTLTFLASGPGTLEQRRPIASDPSRGALSAPLPGVLGAGLGSPQSDDGEDARTALGGARLGAAFASPGLGVARGLPGVDHRMSAAVASGRPDVAPAPVAVNAAEKGRPKDDVDTDQEVATTVQSIVQASAAGGLKGIGRGGSGGGGDPGAGAKSGTGSRSGPLGDGDGTTFDISSSDPRLALWLRQIKAKVDPLWANAFPKSAILDLKQGMVIIAFTVFENGSVAVNGAVRPSGIPEFDRNCADAIRRAAPFPPIPASYGRSSVHITFRFTANNPMVK